MTRLSICALVAIAVISNVNARCTGGGGGGGGNHGGGTNGPMMKGAEVDFNRDIKAKVGGKIKFSPCGRPKSVVNADIKDCGRSNIKGNAFQMLETAGRMAEVLKLVGNRFKPQTCCPPRAPCANDDISPETLCDGALRSRINSPLCNLKQVGGSGNKNGYRKGSGKKGGGNDLSLSSFDSKNNVGIGITRGHGGKYSTKRGGARRGGKKSLRSRKRKHQSKRYNNGGSYNNGGGFNNGGGNNNNGGGHNKRGHRGGRGGSRGSRYRPTETRTHTTTGGTGGNDNDYSLSASMVDSGSFGSDSRGRDYDTGDNDRDTGDDNDYDNDYDQDDYGGNGDGGDYDNNEVDDADGSNGVDDTEYDDGPIDNESSGVSYENDDDNNNVNDNEEQDYEQDYDGDHSGRGHGGRGGGDYDTTSGDDYTSSDYSGYSGGSGGGSNDNVSQNDNDGGMFPRPNTVTTSCSKKNVGVYDDALYSVPSHDLSSVPSRTCLHHIPLGGTKSCTCQQNQVHSGSSRGANCNGAGGGAGGNGNGGSHGTGGGGRHGNNGHHGGSNTGGYKPCGCH